MATFSEVRIHPWDLDFFGNFASSLSTYGLEQALASDKFRYGAFDYHAHGYVFMDACPATVSHGPECKYVISSIQVPTYHLPSTLLPMINKTILGLSDIPLMCLVSPATTLLARCLNLYRLFIIVTCLSIHPLDLRTPARSFNYLTSTMRQPIM